jgi:hypothetical protein
MKPLLCGQAWTEFKSEKFGQGKVPPIVTIAKSAKSVLKKEKAPSLMLGDDEDDEMSPYDMLAKADALRQMAHAKMILQGLNARKGQK